MKKILITGANSYVGVSVENHLKQWQDRYQVDTVDMVDGSWKETSFAGYDAVFHVAGIVHMESTKNDPEQAALYERVNTRLAIETAQKAKAEGVKQFIFMSSASSKAKAEEGLSALADRQFKLAILRPPMIYGKGCRGNYCTMAKLAKKLPFFPYVDNQRSMLYIGNMAEFVRLIVDDEAEGVFCPQNNEYTNTSDMVSQIAHANGRDILMIRGFAWALKLLRHATGIVDKAFGSLCYDFELSNYTRDYCIKNLAESITETEA